MNLYVNWLKKHWIPLAFAALVLVLLGDKACDDAAYRRGIKALDSKIAEDVKKIRGLNDTIQAANKAADAAAAVVVVLEKTIEESRLRDLALAEAEPRIVAEIEALPPTELVFRLREDLECEKIELTEAGVLFPVECARAALVKLTRFDIVEARLEETQFSLSQSLDATHLQKIATWNVYRIAWAQGTQILHYQNIVKLQDQKFEDCEKQRKKGFWSGLVKGVLIGAGITVAAVGIKTVFR
jgi:hypothetical protein